MGGQRAYFPLTREDCGGSELNGGLQAIVAGAAPDGTVIRAGAEALRSLQKRGLVVVESKLTEKGLKLRKKLRGLTA